MKKFIFYVVDCIALVASMLLGVFGAAGLCAAIWGPSILNSALGHHPDRTHPAFILFILVSITGMLIGACGAISGIILPLHLRFRIPLLKSQGFESKYLRIYASKIVEYTSRVD